MNFPLKIGQPRFLTADELLALHGVAVATHGGSPELRDRAALESALAMPAQGMSGQFVHEFPFEMAAAYGFHLAKGHPFVDGNKRAALAAMAVFLRLNGWTIRVADEDAASLILDVVVHGRDKAWLADRLAATCRARPSLELRDFFASLGRDQAGEFLRGLLLGQDGGGVQATIDEARRHMPLIRHLEIVGSQMERAGDTADADKIAFMALALITIYRTAEEMGYEW